MRTLPAFGFATLVVLSVIACSERNAEKRSSTSEDLVLMEPQADPTPAVNGSPIPAPSEPAPTTSSAAQAGNDSNRRMIRTADIRFRVKDVVQSTYAIEDVVRRFDGFVTNTELRSTIDSKENTPISEDSLVEITRYTVINQLTFRVPNTQLDTTLKCLAAQVDFMDRRNITANDVSLSLLRNQLEQSRIMEHEARVESAIDEQGRKLKETLPAEDRLLDRQGEADEALLSNLGMEDRIAYSTVTLDLYQRQNVRAEMLPNTTSIKAYSPGFLVEFISAVRGGWSVLESLVLLLVRAWSILLIVLVGWLLGRRYLRGKVAA